MIDLGLGLGRVGLTCTLVLPDIHFVGYQHVPHQVLVANEAVERFGLPDRLQFVVRDLASREFQIPETEVFYLYDPFSEETYRHVLEQLVATSKCRKIIVVTKGNARRWLAEIAQDNFWSEFEALDQGNICIFQSAL